MSTIRVAARDRFTAIDRRTLNDERLSFRARGLLAWLLDKPDDWRVNSDQIARHTQEGRDAVRTALRELADAGYVQRARIQDSDGKWVTETVIHERPPSDTEPAQTALTEDGFPGVGKPGVGFPGANTKTVTEDCYPPPPQRDTHVPREAEGGGRKSPLEALAYAAAQRCVETDIANGTGEQIRNPDAITQARARTMLENEETRRRLNWMIELRARGKSVGVEVPRNAVIGAAAADSTRPLAVWAQEIDALEADEPA